MVDKRITELDALTAVDDGDLLEIVDDPAGTPTNKKITRADLLAGVGGANGQSWLAIPYETGRYYSDHLGRSTSTTQSLSAGRMYATPFIPAFTHTFDRLGINVTTLQADSLIHLGIYASLSDGYPGALIVDAGTVDSSSTGAKELTISETLEALTLYWLAVLSDTASVAVEAIPGASQRISRGSASLSLSSLHHTLFRDSQSSLPDPFGSPSSFAGGPAPMLRAT